MLPPRGGAAGRDTRGIFRVHQFDKVEMFSFVRPEDSEAEHERLLETEEAIMQGLEIPYRVVNIAVDDLGSSAAKKYDIEAWLPGQQRYRELTSTSNTTDFQARRLDIRYRPADGGKPRHAHTLNGTAVAVGRTLIALLENHQRDDGTVGVPEVLHRVGCAADPAGRRRRDEPRRRSPRTTPRSPTSRRPPRTARPRSTTSRSARPPSCPRRTRRCPASPSASRPRPTSNRDSG